MCKVYVLNVLLRIVYAFRIWDLKLLGRLCFWLNMLVPSLFTPGSTNVHGCFTGREQLANHSVKLFSKF